MTPQEMEAVLETLDRRLSGMDERLGRVETRLERVETRVTGMDERLGRVETRLERVESRLEGVDVSVQNLDRRTASIEQILPTLATKDDVTSLRTEMRALNDENIRETRELVETASRRVDVLFEDLRGSIGLLAEHLVPLMDDYRRRRES